MSFKKGKIGMNVLVKAELKKYKFWCKKAKKMVQKYGVKNIFVKRKNFRVKKQNFWCKKYFCKTQKFSCKKAKYLV